ncbi:unnamed protein product [Camellia sinensis]
MGTIRRRPSSVRSKTSSYACELVIMSSAILMVIRLIDFLLVQPRNYSPCLSDNNYFVQEGTGYIFCRRYQTPISVDQVTPWNEYDYEGVETMEMVDGMVDVDMVEEAELGEDAAVFLDVEEAMVVGICNKTWVVTMVDQGHRLLKAVRRGRGRAHGCSWGCGRGRGGGQDFRSDGPVQVAA